ncbi:CoF synthetase [Ascidiimonas aurantiaca]|uniref:CoF synthetase n=1 Tax=Ascidiimonas aurantiaca TaxID=1685432 RepID=UPI0030EB7CFE
MHFFHYIRNRAFWAFDFLKGGDIYRKYKYICFINEHYEDKKALRLKKKSLQDILKHTATHIPFYQKYNGVTKLTRFPVISKRDMAAKIDDFILPGQDKDKLHKALTSGSTGAPFTSYKDRDKRNRNAADVIYFAESAGFKLGSTLFYLRRWSEDLIKSKLSIWLQNIVPVDVLHLSDKEVAKLLEKLLKDRADKNIIGYPSSFDTIRRYLKKHKVPPKDYRIKSIIATSEALPNHVKQEMQYYFKTPVVSRYSNMECGIIAQQKPGKGDHFYINWASYHVEIADMENDTPLPYGEPGRIIVTDLFNKVMPFIRYDTGDVGIMSENNEGFGPVLSSIEGRKMDVLLNTKGELISSFAVTETSLFEGIVQSQTIQEGINEYTIKLKVNNRFNREAELINRFKGFLGEDAIITIKYVNEIPLLPSGKHKIMINKYLENKAP